MSLLKSLIFGSNGSYKVMGVPVTFKEKPSSRQMPDLQGAGIISSLAISCINSTAFRFLTQGFTHVFVHEMSHALAYKIVTNEHERIVIYTDKCSGEGLGTALASRPNWQKSLVFAAGAIGDMAFSSCKLVAAVALKKDLTIPVALVVGGGAVMWMSGELLYAFVGKEANDGDFGVIRALDSGQHKAALAALVGECALGVLAAVAVIYTQTA